MTELLDDVSLLTDIPETFLKKLVNVATKCVSHSVYEGLTKHEDVVIVDIGLGELHIKIFPNEIRYKFIPSPNLETDIVNSIKTRTSSIAHTLDSNFVTKIQRAYKELL